MTPVAILTVLKKYLPICASLQAVTRFSTSKPLGHRLIGERKVSCVVEIADLASHSNGPSPTMTSTTSNRALTTRSHQRTVGRCRSIGESTLRFIAFPGHATMPPLLAAPRLAPRRSQPWRHFQSRFTGSTNFSSLGSTPR